MFHLMIGMWAVGMFAAAIAIALIPLWLGFLVQFLIGVFSTGKVARWVPAILGALGLLRNLWSCIQNEMIGGLKFVLIYWGIYALLLWAAHSLGRKVQKWWLARKGRG